MTCIRLNMLTIDETCREFSDGTHIWFDTHSPKDILMEPSDADHPTPLDDAHAEVQFSDTAIIIYLTAGPLPTKGILLSAPVTVGDILKAISDFYSTEITAAEHAALKDWKYGDERWPYTQSEELYRVYGSIQHGYWYEGLRKRAFERDWWKPRRPFREVPNYPPYVACGHQCEVYRTYDVMWGS